MCSATRCGVMAVVIGLLAATAVPAGIIFVDDDAPPGGDGQTWSTAHRHLQDALSAARASGGAVTEVWVAAGVYRPDRDGVTPAGTGSRTATFQLVSGVAIRGGFAGTEDPATFNLAARAFTTSTSILSGDLAGNDVLYFTNDGENSYHVVTGSGVGALSVLDGFTISGGNANGQSPHYYGAGVYILDGDPTLRNCTFRLNRASQHGGGAYNRWANPSFDRCVFDLNVAGAGGGMYNGSSSPRLTHCLMINNNTLWGEGGGGVYNLSGTPVMVNCVFSWNSDSATFNLLSSPTIVNCTYMANSIAVESDQAGSPTMVNCIVWGNRLAGVTGTATTTVTYSCIEGGWPGQGNISTDPRLFLGASEQVRIGRGSPCIDAGNRSAVPADLNQDWGGNPRFVNDPQTPDTGTGPAPAVDMGAWEYQPGSPAPSRLFVDDDAAPGGDGSTWASAHRYLQDALWAAWSRGGAAEIWVAAGVYKPDRDAQHPDGTRNRFATFQILDGVALRGGFAGDEDPATFDLSARSRHTNASILSGDLAGDDGPNFANYTENAYRVLTSPGAGPSTVLDTFAVTAGAVNAFDAGSGVYNLSGNLLAVNCSFIANGARTAANAGGTLTLTDCRFSGNSTSVYNSSDGTTLLNNCGIDGLGGLVRNDSGSVVITNCTLRCNLDTPLRNTIGSMTVLNSVVWGRTPAINGAATVSHSCVQGGWAGEGNIATDPLFVNAAIGDLRLSAGSPCIDAGQNSAVPAGRVTDLDGHPRFMDDPDAADCVTAPGTCGTAPIVDMGAYEFIPVITGDFDRNGYVNVADFDVFGGCALGATVFQTDANCRPADFDDDGDVDQDDFGVFQRCYSGAEPASAGCGLPH